MLELGHNTPLTPNAKVPDDIALGISRDNMCPMPSEFSVYAQKHPKEGMPLAVTGLTDGQYQTLQRWLAAGSPLLAMPGQIDDVDTVDGQRQRHAVDLSSFRQRLGEQGTGR